MSYSLTPFGRTALRTAKTAYPRFNGCESGFRFFSPGIGRWMSRDPIGEKGGGNLLCFIRNCPDTALDYLGLRKACYQIRIGKFNLKEPRYGREKCKGNCRRMFRWCCFK